MARLSFFETLRNEKPELFNEFIRYMQLHTYEEVARHFAPQFGIEEGKLLGRLAVWNTQYKIRKFNPAAHLEAPSLEGQEKKSVNDEGLSSEELGFLDKFRTGEISFDDVQREFAYRVLRKVLQNPDLLKVADWLKSEVIKIKREELSMKKEYMERSWGMLFGGFLIPKLCPKCGHDLQPKVAVPIDSPELKILEGEITHDTKPLGVAAGISPPQS